MRKNILYYLLFEFKASSVKIPSSLLHICNNVGQAEFGPISREKAFKK